MLLPGDVLTFAVEDDKSLPLASYVHFSATFAERKATCATFAERKVTCATFAERKATIGCIRTKKRTQFGAQHLLEFWFCRPESPAMSGYSGL